MEHGKREVSHETRKKVWLIPLIIVLALAVIYGGLCVYASRILYWPNTSVAGVDISGKTYGEAEKQVKDTLAERWNNSELTFLEEDSGRTYTLAAGGMAEADHLYDQIRVAVHGGHPEASFLTLGGRYLAHTLSGNGCAVTPEVELTAEGNRALRELVDRIGADAGVTGRPTTCQRVEDTLVITKGITGTMVDGESLRSELTRVLMGDMSRKVTVTMLRQSPEDLDWGAIREEICTEPVDAMLHRETWEVVPSVTGVDFDLAAARNKMDHVADGAQFEVDLILTEPEITTELLKETLFKDVLGSTATKFHGTAARRKNVALSCRFLNGKVIFPGESFSYNQACSPYTAANGYGKAGAYVNGKTVDTTAGGICQTSSTLYWAALQANMKIDERHAHRYEPSYIRGGLDATVYGDYGDKGSLDFRFTNSSEAPVKLLAGLGEDGYVRVSILGTNTSGILGKPFSNNRVITQYGGTLYEANADVPAGTTQRDPERTAYNAVSIDTYQQLVDGAGNVISTTFLYTTRYKSRNAVIFYNPADTELWGVDPDTGKLIDPEATPLPSVMPSQLPQPSGTPGPEDPVLPPEVSTVPTENPGVTPTELPAVQPTAAPAVTPSAEPVPTPTAEPSPAPTAVPEVPSSTPGPETTEVPPTPVPETTPAV